MDSYRCVLEVLKQCAATLTLTSASVVSRCWWNASESKELWYHYLSRADSSPEGYSPNPKFTFQSTVRPLALVGPQCVVVFGCFSQRWKVRHSFTMQVEVDENSAYAFVQRKQLVISGGGKSYGKATAYCFKLETGEIVVLPDMISPRRNHALLFTNGQVYAFGGFHSGYLRSCEAIDLSRKQWTEKHQMMYGRGLFNPCEYEQWVYLCGGLGTDRCEAYSPQRAIGRLLSFLLPEQEATACVMRGDTLIIISRRYISTWHISDEETISSERRKQLSEPQGCMRATLVADSVFVAFYKYVQRIDLSTGLCHYLDYIW